MQAEETVNRLDVAIRLVGGNQQNLSAPPPEAFVGMDGEPVEYLQSPELYRAADALIDRYPDDLAQLSGFTVVYLWRAKGGTTGGADVLGKCQKLSGMSRFLSGMADGEPVDFVIWLAADHLAGDADTFVERALYHEMSHIRIDNESGKPFVAAHDFTGFVSEFTHFGAWREDLRRVERAVRQLTLPGGGAI